MAKIARVLVSKQFLEMVLRADTFAKPNTVTTSNAPKDLEVLGLAIPDFVRGYPHTLEVYVKSETFDDVPEGVEPPLIDTFIYTQKVLEEEC